jgi:hypothetical protein
MEDRMGGDQMQGAGMDWLSGDVDAQSWPLQLALVCVAMLELTALQRKVNLESKTLKELD